MAETNLKTLMWMASLLWELQTPAEKIESLKEQKKSWVYGQTRLSNPDITRELVQKAVEESGKINKSQKGANACL